MKKSKPLLYIALGIVIGWVPASYVTKARFDRWASDWTPELRESIAEAAKFTDTLRADELENLHKNMVQYLEKSRMEIDLVNLHRAMISIQVQSAMSEGNTEGLNKLLKQSQEMFLESHDKGHYLEKEFQDLADSTAAKIRNHDESLGQPSVAPNPPSSGPRD